MDIDIELRDDQWPFDYIDHDRKIVRAIVIDNDGYYYFVRVNRDDDFGKGTLIETSGGGVEDNEKLEDALKRELQEELGANVEIIEKIGIVSDYYNLIHRHNINNYYLCKIVSFTNKHLTNQEINDFHLTTLKLTYKQAHEEYDKCSNSKLGKLIYNREIPILVKAHELIKKN